MRPFARLAGGVALFLAATPLDAHDFWLVPNSFRPAAGSPVQVSLWVGENLRGTLLASRPAGPERLAALQGKADTPVRKSFVPAGNDLVRVVYRSRPRLITLNARKFEQYLHEEGLEAIAALRAKRGHSTMDGRELFSRCAKTLVQPGSDPNGTDRPSGLPLEIIAESNPYAAARVQTFRVDFNGAPLEGILVVALNDRAPPARARTDASGRVTFSINSSGLWLIKAVHMTEARPGTNAEWESLWASLTFDRS